MNLRIITKNLAADSKIGSLLKIDFRADWTHESYPTAWELTSLNFLDTSYLFCKNNLQEIAGMTSIKNKLIILLSSSWKS